MGEAGNERMICGLLGDPVEHSVSPVLFNAFADSRGMKEYYHFKFRICSDFENDLKKAIEGMKAYGFRGFNITLPYKEKIISHLDHLDDTARKMGAVNAIVNEDRKIYGYNTDGLGAVTSIEKSSRQIKADDKVVVVGAGGAARAVCFEVYTRTKNLVILNRTLDNAISVKEQLEQWEGTGVRCNKLNNNNLKKELEDADFILQTTSVGMHPNRNQSLVNDEVLSHVAKEQDLNKVVCWDAIFNPYETLFLRKAKQHGAQTISGLGMMIYQGVHAFKLWTGEDIDHSMIPGLEKELAKMLGQ